MITSNALHRHDDTRLFTTTSLAVLISLQGIVLLPVVAYLPLWIWPFVCVLALLRFMALRKSANYAGFVSNGLLVLLAIMLILYQYGLSWNRDAGLTLLIIAFSLKLYEAYKQRDVIIYLYLSYFIIMTHFLYTQNIYSFLYMVFATWATTVVLIAMHTLKQEYQFIKNVRLAATMLLQATPFMLILFFLFPRLPGPLWSLSNANLQADSGISDTMSPGVISKLAQTASVAFRVRFNDKIVASPLRYFRVYVFDYYDGKTWYKNQIVAKKPALIKKGPMVQYEVMMEPHQQKWLAALDMPPGVSKAWNLSNTHLVSARKTIDRPVRYALQAYPRYILQPELAQTDLLHYLQLPKSGDEQARRFAEDLRAEAGSDGLFITQLFQFFRQNPFIYTLTPKTIKGSDQIDTFLFSSRQGFCEHYAGAFTFLMRAAGIPARVVVGYQGGELNPLDDYLVVRQYDAHAWVEVWLQGRGWIRVDPTAAVAPARIELGMRSGLSHDPFFDRANVANLLRGEINWIKLARHLWDAFDARWNDWILGYNRIVQKEFFKKLGLAKMGWTVIALITLASCVLFLAILCFVLVVRRSRKKPARLLLDYQRFCHKLARIGLPRAGHEGPVAYANRIANTHPELALRVRRICRYYSMLRYGRRKVTKKQLERFHKIVKRFVVDNRP